MCFQLNMAFCFASSIELICSIAVRSNPPLIVHPRRGKISSIGESFVPQPLPERDRGPRLLFRGPGGSACRSQCERRLLPGANRSDCQPRRARVVAWAGHNQRVGPRNHAGNVRMGITMLRQGTDKDGIAVGPVASRSLTDVPEVFCGGSLCSRSRELCHGWGCRQRGRVVEHWVGPD